MIRIKHNGKETKAADGKDAARLVKVALDQDWYNANVAPTLTPKEKVA